ncbi:hypothetical protein LTR95_016158 [Oleoguttula sp. CCFEE 5521]
MTNNAELTLTIIFGCFATVLAVASAIVAVLQYRLHTHHTGSSSSARLEAGVPMVDVTGVRTAPTVTPGGTLSYTSRARIEALRYRRILWIVARSRPVEYVSSYDSRRQADY